MAKTSYFQGKLGLDYLAKKEKNLKVAMDLLSKSPGRSSLYLQFDDGDLKKYKGAYRIKNNPKNLSYVKEITADLVTKKGITLDKTNTKDGDQYFFTVNGVSFAIALSGRALSNVTLESGKAQAAGTPTTAQQEDGFIVNLNAGKLLELKEISHKVGYDFDDSWYHSYTESFKAFTSKIISQRDLDKYIFYRDSDNKKLDFLNKMTDEKILPSKKDNWNPADLWAVRKSKIEELKKEVGVLYDKMRNDKNISIEQLNKYIETKLKNLDIVGVSLKKVEGRKANLDLIKADAKFFKAIVLQRITKKFPMDVTLSYFDLYITYKCFKSENVEYYYRFRPRAKSGELGQSAEGAPVTQKNFDGAVAKQQVLDVYLKQGSDISKLLKKTKMPKTNVADGIAKLDKSYDDFKKFVVKNKYDFAIVKGLTTTLNDEYKVKRGILNLFYLYLVETYKNRQELFRKFYMAAKKMNEFSSIHYKIYG